MAQPEIASCWADLPDDLLELILRPCSEGAHAQRPLSPAEAASLLASMGPCRRWRAVALDRVHFRLRVDSTQELAHPVLQRVRYRELALPELGTLPQPDFGGRNMLLNVDAVFAPAMAALDRHAASVAGLLSNPAFVLSNGGSLAALRNLPPCAAAQAPQLLGDFHNLVSLGLQHTNFRSLNRYRLEELMQPAFFPPSLRHLRVWSNAHIACGGWLPSQHLESLELHAWMVTLGGGGSGQMGGHGCTSLTVHGASRLELGVAAMLGPRFDGLRRVVLSSVTGAGLRLCPLAADEAWLAHDIAQQPGAAEGPDGYGQALLRRWLRILSPLFLAAGSSLQSLQATARNLQLATGIGERRVALCSRHMHGGLEVLSTRKPLQQAWLPRLCTPCAPSTAPQTTPPSCAS